MTTRGNLLALVAKSLVAVVVLAISSGVTLPPRSYMQKTCDVAEKAVLAKKNLRKKCVNRDKM